MKKFFIRASIESFVFALCTTGLTALGYRFMGDKLTTPEVLVSLAATFTGWFVWTVIETYIIDKKK
ncbi:MAG: hypothetical protein IKY75_07005 [Bacteroidaceae bacterium]|nr:hypothetical protein [Bacteroidaceae bacterium]